jgi:hypothetical protein
MSFLVAVEAMRVRISGAPTGYWRLLPVAYWLLAVAYWMLAVVYWV